MNEPSHDLISCRQTYETYAANKDDDNKKFWGKGASDGHNEFDAGETTRYVNRPDLRLSDLGIGKFLPLQYPWNPKNSPNMCRQAGKAVNEEGKEDPDGDYPAEDCNEFIFTKE